MNINQISSLFTLFSGETDTETYRPLIDSAIAQVERRLKEDVQDSDARLDYLCAAIANFRMREYYKAASDLLYDDGFIFTAVCCG